MRPILLLIALLAVQFAWGQDTTTCAGVDSSQLISARQRWTTDILNAEQTSRLSEFQPVTKKFAVVLVDFADYRGTDSVSLVRRYGPTPADLDTMFSKSNLRGSAKWTGGAWGPSLRDYYWEITRKKLWITGKVINPINAHGAYDWIRLDSVAKYGTSWARWDYLTLSLVPHLVDSAGCLDTTYESLWMVFSKNIFPRGSGTNIYNINFPPGSSRLINGVYWNGNMASITQIGPYAHEAGHLWFGFSDNYYPPTSTGNFDLMADGWDAARRDNPVPPNPFDLIGAGIVAPVSLTTSYSPTTIPYSFQSPQFFITPPIPGTYQDRTYAHDSTIYTIIETRGDSLSDALMPGRGAPTTSDTGWAFIWRSKINDESEIVFSDSLTKSRWPGTFPRQRYYLTSFPSSIGKLAFYGIRNRQGNPRAVTIDTVKVYPSVRLSAVTERTQSSMRLNGIVLSGDPATIRFWWGSHSNTYTHTALAFPSSASGVISCYTDVTGLSGGDSVFFRLRAYTAVDSTSTGQVVAVATLSDAPIVYTDSASSIVRTTASLWGRVNPQDYGPASSWFVYGTSSTTYSDSAFYPATIVGSTPTLYAVDIRNLTPNTTYFYRGRARVYQGSIGQGEERFFTTPAPIGSAPIALAYSPASITPTGATFNGSVNANNLSTTVRFLYGTTNGVWTDSTVATQSPVTGSSYTPVSKAVTGLTPGMVYYSCVSAINSAGSVRSSSVSCTTAVSVAIPTVHTSAASNIGSTYFTFNGTVAPGNASTVVRFVYGTTSGVYTDSITAIESPLTGNTSTPVTALLTNRPRGTTHYGRVRAYNSAGGAQGSEVSVTTLADIPTVTTLATTNATLTGAQMNGSINPNGGSTTGRFLWGTVSGVYTDSLTIAQGTLTGNTTTAVNRVLSGLSAATTYYGRLRGYNSAGGAQGAEVSFTTSTPTGAPPGVRTLAATNMTDSTGRMNGSIDANGATTTVRFLWGTTSGVYIDSGYANPQTVTANAVPVYRILHGLSPSTTVYYRLRAYSSAGIGQGSEMVLTSSARLKYVLTK